MNELIKKTIDGEATADKFAMVVSAAGKMPIEDARKVYEVEKLNFLKMLGENTALPANITPISAAGVFLEVVGNGLSFSSTAKHVFCLSRNVKNSAGQYEARLYFQPQPSGHIFLAEQAGSINRMEDPIVVYEGDKFECGTDQNNKKWISHTKSYPRKSSVIMLVYCVVIYPDGSREPFWLDIDDMKRLAGFSEKQNSKWVNGQRQRGKANALYTSGANGQPDEGFWKSKVINFALKNKRKKPLQFKQFLAGNEEAEETENVEYTEDQPSQEPPAQDPKPIPQPTQANVYPGGTTYRQKNWPNAEQAKNAATAEINQEPF